MPQSHDAEGLACQLCDGGVPIAEVGAGAPAAFAVEGCIVLRAVRDGEQMGKHHLGHALRAVGGNVGDDDAMLAGSLHVHHVIARRQHADIFQQRQLLDLLPPQAHLVRQHHLRLLRPQDGLLGLRAVIDRHCAKSLEGLPRRAAGVGSEAVEDGNDASLHRLIA